MTKEVEKSALISCESIFGNNVLVPKEKLTFRASAYAIVLAEGRLLVLRSRSTGQYCFPGGGVDVGESIMDALSREVKEETGIEVEIEGFLHFKEHFFYYDPLDQAFHSFMVFFKCQPVTLDLISNDQVEDEESKHPQWVDFSKLSAEDFQAPLREVFDLLVS